MRAVVILLTVTGFLGGAGLAVAADTAKPKLTTPSPPGGPVPLPYPNVVAPKTVPPAALAPVVSGYAPSRVLAGATVSVLGSNFGDAAAGRVMRVAGSGYSQTLTVVRWTPGEVQVRLPADIRPGAYYVAVADASSRWLSNLERGLEVVDPLRRLTVRLDVTASCELDVATAAASVALRLQGASGAPINVTLRPAGTRDGAQGARVFGYEGHLEARVGDYRMAATDATFTASAWDYINGNARPVPGGGRYIERTNWEDCHAHRRVTSWGAPLPAPTRQTYGVRLTRERLDLTLALDALRLEGFPSTGGLGGAALQTPTPICTTPTCP